MVLEVVTRTADRPIHSYNRGALVPPAAPTPDVEAIVETAVREMLEAIPTLTPLPTPDIEAIVETVLLRATDTLLETLVMGLSVSLSSENVSVSVQ